jgi:hypothetical protein
LQATAMLPLREITIVLGMVGAAAAAQDARAQGVPFERLRADIETLAAQLGFEHQALHNKLMTIDGKLDALALAAPLMPFKTEAPGGICNTVLAPSANPEILIDSDDDTAFVVTSILVRTAPQNPSGYEFLSVNSVRIDGLLFDTRTQNLTAAVDGFGVHEAADLMGTPIRRSSLLDDDEPGGNFPHQIVAEGAGPDDIEIQLFCRTDTTDLDIETVLVSGWKAPDATITATYIPGN